MIAVPIYDAREIHDFTVAGYIERASSLPLYENGEEEVPDGSAVVAAYTIGKAHKNEERGWMETLYFNIQFLILLGLPSLTDSDDDYSK